MPTPWLKTKEQLIHMKVFIIDGTSCGLFKCKWSDWNDREPQDRSKRPTEVLHISYTRSVSCCWLAIATIKRVGAPHLLSVGPSATRGKRPPPLYYSCTISSLLQHQQTSVRMQPPLYSCPTWHELPPSEKNGSFFLALGCKIRGLLSPQRWTGRRWPKTADILPLFTCFFLFVPSTICYAHALFPILSCHCSPYWKFVSCFFKHRRGPARQIPPDVGKKHFTQQKNTF